MANTPTTNIWASPKGRLSFPALFVPEPGEEGQEAKYKATILVEKTEAEAINHLRALCEEAAQEKWGKKRPAGLHMPIRDGAEKTWDGYGPEVVFIRATSNRRPDLVDNLKRPITDPEQLYGGCYVRLLVKPFCYEKKGNSGVSLTLLAVQKVGDGDRFGSSVNIDDWFTEEKDASQTSDASW